MTDFKMTDFVAAWSGPAREKESRKTPEQVRAFYAEQDAKRAEERERAKAKAAENAKRAEADAEAKYTRDLAVIESGLSDAFGSDCHEEIDEQDRRACVEWLSGQFRAAIESSRNRRNLFRPAAHRRERVKAYEPFDGALVVVWNTKRPHVAEVTLGELTYVMAPGANHFPPELSELGALEAMLARGEVTLHVPGATVPDVASEILAARAEALRTLERP
jgi:hypothetical protein